MQIALVLLQLAPYIAQLVSLIQVLAPLFKGEHKKEIVTNHVRSFVESSGQFEVGEVEEIMKRVDPMIEEQVLAMKELSKKLNAASSGTFGGQ